MRPLRQQRRLERRATSRVPGPRPRYCPEMPPARGGGRARLRAGSTPSRLAPKFLESSSSTLLPFEPQQQHIAAPPAMEKVPAPSTPTEAKAASAEAKEDPNRLPSFIPRTGLVFSERTAFAPVLCPPKLLPIRPYHVQRGQAQDSDDDDEAPPPKEGEEKKSESTTDVYDKRYLAEKKLIGDWGREPVVDEGYDPSKPLELVQKPAAEPAAAS